MKFTPGHAIFEPRIDLIGAGLVAIVAAMLASGFAFTAERPVSTKKGDKAPINTPAQVAPGGGVGFGEAAPTTPAQQRRFLLKWAEMPQAEINTLTAAMMARDPKGIVHVICKDPMCEDLALNIDNAFESAKWKSDLMIGTQFGVPDGVTASDRWLADLFNHATNGRYAARVDDQRSAPGTYLLIGPKPRGGQ